MIWSALEVGSVCYAHADNVSLYKLQRFQDITLRQMGLSHKAVDSITTRRKVTYATLIYKLIVLGEGPGFLHANFPIKARRPTCPSVQGNH